MPPFLSTLVAQSQCSNYNIRKASSQPLLAFQGFIGLHHQTFPDHFRRHQDFEQLHSQSPHLKR